MTESESKEYDDLHEMLKATAEKVGEHFDSVVIICTKQFGYSRQHGRLVACSGSDYASMAAAREWVLCNDESARICQRKKEEGE